MTTVHIALPDQLAQEVERAGLLSPGQIEQMLRERLRAEAVERLDEIMARLDATPSPPMTPDEIQAEIGACRSERRRASGS